MADRRLMFEAIGTNWQIDVRQPMAGATWHELQQHLQKRIKLFEVTLSRFRQDSWVWQLSEQAGEYPTPADVYPLLVFYKQLYDATGGLVTPLIGQTMRQAGYDENYSFRSGRLSRPLPWEEVIEFDKSKIIMKQPALLDFGAAGKGYLIDLLAKELTDNGLKEFTIDGSGDILHRSAASRSVTIGLQDPLNFEKVLGAVRLGNQSLCASAGSRRRWQSFHHLINPHSLKSPTEILAAWAIAADTMTADGLATALFFAEPGKLAKTFEFDFASLSRGGQLSHSPGFNLQTFKG